LIAESKLDFDQNFRVLYSDLNEITYELKNKNIDKLIEWCQNQKYLLENIKSNLHFEALRLKVKFIFIIQNLKISNSQIINFFVLFNII